jgi:60 kDa SS-A/Ro ribonucleoprotein
MANKNLFKTVANKAPEATTVNNAGGKAYQMSPKAALAQIAATNTFNGTFYASAENNLKLAQEAVKNINDPEFIAKVAVYSRHKAYMKDMPAFLVAVLACMNDGKASNAHDRSLFRRAFRKVIDNGKMLSNFVQIGRSGVTGKVLNMSSGAVRSAIQEWFDTRSPEAIFRASVGIDLPLKDILKMARPRPKAGSAKAALYAYLTDTPFNEDTQCYEQKRKDSKGSLYVAHSDPWSNLPDVVRAYNLYKKHPVGTPPNVDFRLLTCLNLGTEQWTEIARNAGWMMTRMNLQTFERHGVFNNKDMVKLIADRLRDPEEISKARAFPYQLLVAFMNTESVPQEIREALQDAMEVATDNVPVIDGNVYIAVDVSGSMGSSITGYRTNEKGQPIPPSKVCCVHVASLFAATLVRKNKLAPVYPFDQRLHSTTGFDILNPRDSIVTNAQKLAKYGGGGTNCSLVLDHLNRTEVRNAKAVIYISDYESWMDSGGFRGTGTMEAWKKFEKRNPGAKLINIDLTPRNNSQVSPQGNILQVGSWGDEAFNVIKNFIDHGNNPDHWVKEIEAVEV